MQSRSFYLVFLISFLFHIQNVWAFKLIPMEVEIHPKLASSSYAFTLENPTEKKIAIHAQVYTREHSDAGKETREIAKDFSLYPGQMVLEPFQIRTIRINYNGKKDITREIPYRLVVDQVPVSFEKEKKKSGNNLGFYLSYVASVYVTPEAVTPNVVATLEEKDKRVFLVLENKGTKHKIMTGAELQITNGKKEIRVVPESIVGNLSVENILPGQQRRFDLTSMNLRSPPYSVSMEYKKPKVQ